MSGDEAGGEWRSLTNDDFDFDAEVLDLSVERHRAHTLAKAMRVWGDPELVDELAAIERVGPLSTLASVFGKETAADRQAVPFTRVTDCLRSALLEKLYDGRLVATGFEQGAPAYAAPTDILPARWPLLKADFDDSSATGSGIFISGIRVRELGVVMSGAAVRANVNGRPRPISFAIGPTPGRVTFDELVVLTGSLVGIITKLLPGFFEGLRAGRGDDGFVPMRAATLAAQMKVTEVQLRRNISRLRSVLHERFKVQLDVSLRPNSIIENVGRRGYRLNPSLSPVHAFQDPLCPHE